jgi:hypothetical protein
VNSILREALSDYRTKTSGTARDDEILKKASEQ